MEYLKCHLCNASGHEVNELSCKPTVCNKCFYKLCLFNRKLIETFTYDKEKELALKCIFCESGTLKFSKDIISKKLNEITKKAKEKAYIECFSHYKKLNGYCIECPNQMSDDCFSSHDAFPMWSWNENEVNAIKSAPFLNYICSLHENRPFHYFCSNCNSLLCELCKKTHNKEHRIRFLQEFYNEKKEEFLLNFEVPPNSAKEIFNTLKDSDLEFKAKIIKEVAKLKDRIHSVIDYLDEVCVKLDKELENICEEIDVNYIIRKTLIKNLTNDFHNLTNSTEFDFNILYLDKIPKITYQSKRQIDNELITGLLKEFKNSMENFELKINNKSVIKINNYFKGNLSTETITTITESNPQLDKTNSLLSLERTLKGHSASVKKLIQLKDGRIASCSNDLTIKIWDHLDNFKPTNSITAHNNTIYNIIELRDQSIASCSMDKTIKIWNPKDNFKCTNTLTGHCSYVTVIIQLFDGKIASGSWDKTIKIWDPYDNFNCTHTLIGHTDYIACLLLLKDGRILSGSYDTSIRIWNTNDNFKMTHKLNGHAYSVKSLLQINDDLIASGSDDGSIRIWNIMKSLTSIQTLSGHLNNVCCLIKLHDGKMASASYDNTIKIWDPTENFLCIHTLSGHYNLLSSVIQLKDGKIAHGSSDELIRIWD